MAEHKFIKLFEDNIFSNYNAVNNSKLNGSFFCYTSTCFCELFVKNIYSSELVPLGSLLTNT